MGRRLVILLGLFSMTISPSLVGSAWGAETKELRVCGDPDNLPFSNKKREGFENKIAEVIAKELGAELTYYWWPHQRGMVRRTLKAGQCDVLISVPHGWEPVLWTRPYYRSGYVIVYSKERGLKITSLDDPILKQLKIGVYINSPPAEALAENGIVKNVVGYNLLYDYQQDRPGKIIEDLIAGDIGVAVVWGPVAGYYTRKLNASHLDIVPLQGGGPSIPFTFEFSMGVREGNKALKAQLEGALSKRQTEIQKILEDYGVPLLPLLAKGQFGPVKDQPGQIIYHRD
ncbi:MAG: quinoprotein dehydrogenase-associated putative ABC transporter substrate-binding protein [candidate division NC10 bacterium]|nr:quinoprotein dehydrogenase-associated putative ABC transporter substrate-binding protein [candidate division NC10 bacterium]